MYLDNVYMKIKKDKQIWKFCFYGLLKDLDFFEPYLLIYLIGMGMSLFKIGILFSIRETIIYVFEIPSGIFADNYGKKKELMICFVFYIISFILFFIGSSFYILIIAMIFYGLGEAFRSGTHKAMIYSYLEQKKWFSHKAFIYGRTRSFALLGSAISALLSILFILNLPAVRWIFLICIIPYLIDFFLIWSYPDSLDEASGTPLSIKTFFSGSGQQLKNIFQNKLLSKVLISSSLYDGIFKSIKDYIQPILKAVLLTVTVASLKGLTPDKKLIVFLGLIYFSFYIFSSVASNHVYKLSEIFGSDKLMHIFFDVTGLLSLALFISIRNKHTLVIVSIYFLLYLLKDTRRTLIVDVLGDLMNKNERATVMSVESQLTSVFTVIFSPLLGFIADTYSISTLFLVIGVFIIIANRFLKTVSVSNEISYNQLKEHY